MAEFIGAFIYSLGLGMTLKTATWIANMIIYAAIGTGVSLLSSALQTKSKKRASAVPSLSERIVTNRDPIASRKLVFGTIRKGGNWVML